MKALLCSIILALALASCGPTTPRQQETLLRLYEAGAFRTRPVQNTFSYRLPPPAPVQQRGFTCQSQRLGQFVNTTCR